MSTHNTALGNAFAEILKTNQIKIVNTMNTTSQENTVEVSEAHVTEKQADTVSSGVNENSQVSEINGMPQGFVFSDPTALSIAKNETIYNVDEHVESSADASVEATLNQTDVVKPEATTVTYPDPESVLHNVEERSNTPRSKKSFNKPKSTMNTKPVQKPKAALFALSGDRPASTLLKNIFDSSTIDGVDDVDHINIHNDAATKLGRLLDMNANTPFVHPELGTFHCVGGMWHYIKTRPFVEEYRILTGAQLRRKVAAMKVEARENPNAPQTISVKGFRTIMADAMWHKVTQNPEIVKLISESTLPFAHYFTQGALGIRQYPSEGFWTVAAFEEIRRVIKHRLSTGDLEAQPDFSKIETMTDPRAGVEKPRQPHQRRTPPNPYGKPEREHTQSYFNRAR